jgi:hypothetical protein
MSNPSPEQPPSASSTTGRVVTILSNFVATAGAAAMIWTAYQQRQANAAGPAGQDIPIQPMGNGPAVAQPAAGPAPAGNSCLPVLIYAAYAFPNITGAWTNWGKASQTDNDFVTAAAIGKVVADWRITSAGWRTASPIVECVVNFIWLGPAISAFVDSDKIVSDWTGLFANLAFDASGMLAPCSEVPTCALAIDVLNGVYGFLSLATAIALIPAD